MVSGTLTIVALDGQPVSVGNTVNLSAGETVTLTPTGMVFVAADNDLGSSVISYEVVDGAGNTDIAFVTITTTVNCFTAEAKVVAKDGSILVENLKI